MAQDVPPPPPVQPPPPPSFTPPAKSAYYSKRQDELDAVRKRGLAKIFNKHFTTVASKIQQERAAAELALAELERRKAELSANPKSFNGGITLTQLDKLYMELKRRKNEVFRKERETQELYKRYVSQYGGDNGKSKSNPSDMPVLHEYEHTDILWQSDLMLAKATEKNEATKDSDVGKLADQYINECSNVLQAMDHTSSNNIGKLSDRVYLPEKQDDSYLAPSPSNLPLSPDAKNQVSKEFIEVNALASPAPTSTTSSGSATPEIDPQDRDIVQQVATSPSVLISLQGESSHNSDSLLGGVMVTTKGSNELDESDDASTMSGLTTIDGATVVEAEWRLTEFLRIETENIRKMFADEEESKNGNESVECNDLISNNSTPSIIVGEVSQAAKKAEEMVKQMEAATAWMQDPTLLDSDSEDEDEHEDEDETILRGLEWKCYWSEEHDREYYYNTATEQTCWTKPQDVEIDYSSMRKNNSHSQNENDYDDMDSVASGAFDNDADSVTVKDYTKTRRILVDTQALSASEFTNEEMIDVFRPDNDAISVSSRGSVRQSSKVLQYRRKRARYHRMKRRLRFAVCAVVVASVYYYVRKQNLDTSRTNEVYAPTNDNQVTVENPINAKASKENESEAFSAAQQLETNNFNVVEDNKFHPRQGSDKEMEVSPTSDIKFDEEKIQIKATQDEQVGRNVVVAVEDEYKEYLLDSLQDKHQIAPQAEYKEQRTETLQEKHEEHIAEEQKADFEDECEAPEIAEGENKSKELTHVTAMDSENMQVNENVRYSRPLNCAIPFAYIPSKKCRDLATEQPIYDCRALTDSMME